MDIYFFMHSDTDPEEECNEEQGSNENQGTSHPTTSAGEPTDVRPPIHGK